MSAMEVDVLNIIPSMRICRICLLQDVKMYKLNETLRGMISDLSRITFEAQCDVCFQCVGLLQKCHRLREKCKLANNVLQNALKECQTTGFLQITPLTQEMFTTEIVNIDIKGHPTIEVNPLMFNEIKVEEKQEILDDVIKNDEDIKPSVEPDFDFDDGVASERDDDDFELPLSLLLKEDARKLKSALKIKKYRKVKIRIRRKVDKPKEEPKDALRSLIDHPPGKVKKSKFKLEDTLPPEVLNQFEIKRLTYEEQLEEMWNRKNCVNYKQSPFKCDKCFKGFLQEGSYSNHMVKHSDSSGSFECPVCHIRFVAKHRMRNHFTSNHASRYTCKQCGCINRNISQAKEHHFWHNGQKFVCELCGESFTKKTTILSHKRLKHPCNALCSLCGESFVSYSGLAMHIGRIHQIKIKKGITKLEADTDEFRCDRCSFNFANSEALSTHSKSHMEKNSAGRIEGVRFECSKCCETFASRLEMWAHRREAHANQTNIACSECDKVFATVRSRAHHYKNVHGTEDPALAKRLTKPDRKKNVICELCGKKFMSYSFLKYHMRIHTGERPYKCNDCGKSFRMTTNLIIHQRIHTGEKPFKCHLCPKAFSNRGAINRHMLVHTGERPYPCLTCGKSFAQSNGLKLHVNSIHLHIPTPYKSRRKNRNSKHDDDDKE